MTDLEIFEVIEKVAENHKNKSFDCHSPEDIKNQVWVIALEKRGDFIYSRAKNKDPKLAFESWLNVVISNRLKNFHRDKKKKNPENCISINALTNCVELISNDYFLTSETWVKIKFLLSDESIEILDSVLSGEKVNSYYKQKLFKEIEKCLAEQK